MFETNQKIKALYTRHGVTEGCVYTVTDIGAFDSVFIRDDYGACRCFSSEASQEMFELASDAESTVAELPDADIQNYAKALRAFCRTKIRCDGCPFDGKDKEGMGSCKLFDEYPKVWEVD